MGPMNNLLLIQLLLLALTLTPTASVHAEVIDYSWWDRHYETSGLFTYVAGGYSRSARLPDADPIQVGVNDPSFKTNRDVARILVMPPGSVVVDPNAFTSRAQSDFGKNHAQTRTITSGFAESEDRQFYDGRSHSMIAESI